MVLKYTSKRPDEELDGLQDLEDHFTKGNPDAVIVVAEISRHGITRVDPSPDWTATIRVRHVEVVTDQDAETVKGLLRSRYEKRTGNAPLPIDDIDPGESAQFEDFPEGGEPE